MDLVPRLEYTLCVWCVYTYMCVYIKAGEQHLVSSQLLSILLFLCGFCVVYVCVFMHVIRCVCMCECVEARS